jgi:AcrR family transcriptional regulator
MSETNRKKEKYHHGDLRQATINTAVEIVAVQGVEALTLREVAQRIGVSRMAPYRHFENKSALLAAVAEEGFEMMYRHLQQTLAQLLPEPLPKLQKLGVAYVLYATSHPTHYRVMFGSQIEAITSYPNLDATAKKNFNLLLQSIVECQKAELICRDRPEKIAQMLWSLTHGLSMLIIDGQLSGTESVTEIEEIANFATRKSITGLLNQQE